MVGHEPGPVGQLRIVCEDSPGVTIGTQVLPWVEARSRGGSARSGGPATLSGTVRLGRVLEHKQAVPGGHCLDALHVRHLAVQVNGNDAYSPRGYCRVERGRV